MGLRASMLQLAILGELHQPLHGYELRKKLSETLGPLRRLSFGSLYPALHRLEAAGLIAQVPSNNVPGPSSGKTAKGAKPKRRQVVYKITPAGERHLTDSLDEAEVDDESLPLTMGLMSKASPATRLTLLTQRRQAVVARKEAGDKAQGDPDFWVRAKAELDSSQADEELRWLDHLIEIVGAAPELGKQNEIGRAHV